MPRLTSRQVTDIELGANRAPKLDATAYRSGLRPLVVANKLAWHINCVCNSVLHRTERATKLGSTCEAAVLRRSSAKWSAEETLLLFLFRSTLVLAPKTINLHAVSSEALLTAFLLDSRSTLALGLGALLLGSRLELHRSSDLRSQPRRLTGACARVSDGRTESRTADVRDSQSGGQLTVGRLEIWTHGRLERQKGGQQT